MKEFESLKDALHYRMTESEDNYFVDTFWEEEVRLACADLKETIDFVATEITDEELWWLGEVFDDILEKTHSREFLKVVEKRTRDVLDTRYKKDLENAICMAADYISGE